MKARCLFYSFLFKQWLIIQMHGSFNENLHETVEISLADGYGMNVCKIYWGLQVLCYSFSCYCSSKILAVEEWEKE